ncbi:MAG: RNA 3'-terminal phosphate cyclase [Crenarchaeota archaeon]|nr:RNA 3'-terminal phosphate cyclase [Thermoproteota archaeon]
MLEVDGSLKSGSGTILRFSVALAAITGQPLHLFNIRKNRPKQGLKPQHLEAVLTATKICNAETRGVSLNSKEIWFIPREIVGGVFCSEIGTAGSIPMLVLTLLPICIFSKTPVQLNICKGGTDTIQAPTINYLQHVLLPTLQKMGISTQLKIERYGYYPKGMGEINLIIYPAKAVLPFSLETFGNLININGISVCTNLADRKVAERQAKAANDILNQQGYFADIKIVNGQSNPVQKGSSLVLWAQTDSGVLLGSDAIGDLHKTSEAVGKQAAQKLLAELKAKPTVDSNLADMLIPFMSLARGSSVYYTRALTDHIQSNIWIAEMILNVRFRTEKIGTLYRIEKLAQ